LIHLSVISWSHARLTFAVSDDGVGFDLNTAVAGSGLRNMHDRVASLGASLTIETALEAGARIAGAVPLTASVGAAAPGN
jgi:signal transduction histidine kinase